MEACVQSFKERLQEEQLRPGTVGQYLEQGRLFLDYLDRHRVQLERAALTEEPPWKLN
jgi:phosphoribosylformylglycinamidine (FGAM) synthase-like enzyme